MTATHNTIHDECLPQLSVAQNEAMMQTVLESSLHCTIERCRILQCRYKPAKTCLISYALTMPGNSKERIVYARIYPEDESFAHYQKARARASLGQHVLHIPAFEMVLWLFPNDRKITALGDFANDSRLQTQILPEVVAESFGTDWQIEALHTNIEHYVAEHTCTVKAELRLRHATTNKTQTPALFGKMYYNEQGAATWQAMQQLQRCKVKTARPLSYQPQLKTLWQLGLDGQTLNDLFAEARFAELLVQAAQSVAQLHSCKAQSVACLHEDYAARFTATANWLALVKPESKARLDALLTQLAADATLLDSRSVALLHGDLHLKNFFVTADGIALIDLDNLSLGDPLADLGSFVASLYYRQLLGELPHAPELVYTFIEAYRRHMSWHFSDADLRWHIVASLIGERVARCITRLKASHLIDDLLELAARIQTGGLP